jgi:hypothetical protein
MPLSPADDKSTQRVVRKQREMEDDLLGALNRAHAFNRNGAGALIIQPSSTIHGFAISNEVLDADAWRPVPEASTNLPSTLTVNAKISGLFDIYLISADLP